MPDREKVIKGLECCAAMSGDECHKCPYGAECRDTDLPYGMPHLASDALDLLKEQEAVKPVPPEDEFGLYRCGKCYNQLFRCVDKYCSRCGQAVKWERNTDSITDGLPCASVTIQPERGE